MKNISEDGFPTFRETAEVVVRQIISNYVGEPYDNPTRFLIANDINTALKMLWPSIKFSIEETFNSYSMVFRIKIDLDPNENDPIFVNIEYSWA